MVATFDDGKDAGALRTIGEVGDAEVVSLVSAYLDEYEVDPLLRPGGELWCVWNSPLRYAPALQRTVGPTRQLARTPKFTVTVSRRR